MCGAGLGSTFVGYHLADREREVASLLGIPDDVTGDHAAPRRVHDDHRFPGGGASPGRGDHLQRRLGSIG
jgi:hypothetical protein